MLVQLVYYSRAIFNPLSGGGRMPNFLPLRFFFRLANSTFVNYQASADEVSMSTLINARSLSSKKLKLGGKTGKRERMYFQKYKFACDIFQRLHSQHFLIRNSCSLD